MLQPQPEAGQTGKIGAFDAPKPSKQAVSTAIRSGTPVPEPVSSSVALNPSTGTTQATSKEVTVPKTDWGKSTTVEKAKTPPKPGWQTAVATYVQDGDTAKMGLADGSSVTCRVDGIDAPETAKPKRNDPGQPFGDASKSRLQEMIENKEVNVRISYPEKKNGKDTNHGRALCQIEFEGKDVSATMVQEGLAWVYDHYVKSSSLKKLETEAKANKRGLWADDKPVQPYIHRKIYEKSL